MINMHQDMNMRKPPKPTNTDIINAICLYVYGTNGFRGEIEKVDNIPEVARHSCEHTGICLLYRQMYNVLGNTANMFGWRLQIGDDMTTGEVPYLFCNACGKLYLPKILRVI